MVCISSERHVSFNIIIYIINVTILITLSYICHYNNSCW